MYTSPVSRWDLGIVGESRLGSAERIRCGPAFFAEKVRLPRHNFVAARGQAVIILRRRLGRLGREGLDGV